MAKIYAKFKGSFGSSCKKRIDILNSRKAFFLVFKIAFQCLVQLIVLFFLAFLVIFNLLKYPFKYFFPSLNII